MLKWILRLEIHGVLYLNIIKRLTILNKSSKSKIMSRRIRAKIHNDFTRSAEKHIKKGDLKLYSTDGIYIYRKISQREYVDHEINSEWMMEELGIEAEYDYNFKG